jgi:hypothetical protein
MLEHRGHIYTSKHEGWYSISDETFYPQTQVQNSLDPSTGRKRMVSGGMMHGVGGYNQLLTSTGLD